MDVGGQLHTSATYRPWERDLVLNKYSGGQGTLWSSLLLLSKLWGLLLFHVKFPSMRLNKLYSSQRKFVLNVIVRKVWTSWVTGVHCYCTHSNISWLIKARLHPSWLVVPRWCSTVTIAWKDENNVTVDQHCNP